MDKYSEERLHSWASETIDALTRARTAMEDAWYATLALRTYVEDEDDVAEARQLSRTVFGLFDEWDKVLTDHADSITAML